MGKLCKENSVLTLGVQFILLPCRTQGHCWGFGSVFPSGCRQGFVGVMFSISYLSSSQLSRAVDPSLHPSWPACSGRWGSPASAHGLLSVPWVALCPTLSLRQTAGFTQVTHRCWEWPRWAKLQGLLHRARLPNLSCYVVVWTGLLREKTSREEILVTLLATLKARGSIQQSWKYPLS